MAKVVLFAAEPTDLLGPGDVVYVPVATGALYCAFTTEARAQIKWPAAGVLSGLWVRIVSNDIGASSTVESRIASASGAQSVSIPAATTGDFADSTHSDTLASGDLVNYRITVGAGGTDLGIRVLSGQFAATTNTTSHLAVSAGKSDTGLSVTRYYPVAGMADAVDATEAGVQWSSRAAFTWSKAQIFLRTNSRTTTSTARSRVNGSDGNQAISITATTTGFFEDASNSDTIASGDEVSYSLTLGADANTLRFTVLSGAWTSTSGVSPVPGSGTAPGDYTIGATGYAPLGVAFPVATEAEAKTAARVASSVSQLQAYVVANTCLATSTIRVRVNGGDGNQSISVPTLTTGALEDGANTDVLAATDDINYSVAVGAGGTSFTVGMLAMILAAPVIPVFAHNYRRRRV